MITLRRAKQRYDDRRGKLELWLTFYAQAANDPLAEGFGGLAMLNEGRIPPGGTMRGHPLGHAELITYVLSGALAYEDSLDRSAAIQAGESRCMAGAPGVRSSETNSSRTAWTRTSSRSDCARMTPSSTRHRSSLDSVGHTTCAQGDVLWLHVVRGEVTLADMILASGDGVGITSARSVSFTVIDEAEILLLDVT